MADLTAGEPPDLSRLPRIRIASQWDAAELLGQEPAVWHVLSIRDPDRPPEPPHPVEEQRAGAVSMHVTAFSDIQSRLRARHGRILASRDQIAAAIAYGRERSPLLVHCSAGISRSSATAYLIGCTWVSPDRAVGLLDPYLHIPNQHIIRLGADILGDPSVWTAYATRFSDPDQLGGILPPLDG